MVQERQVVVTAGKPAHTCRRGIRDAQTYALLDRKEDALGAFREALDGGFREPWCSTAGRCTPILSLRGDPLFAGMIAEPDGCFAIMRDRLLRAIRTV